MGEYYKGSCGLFVGEPYGRLKPCFNAYETKRAQRDRPRQTKPHQTTPTKQAMYPVQLQVKEAALGVRRELSPLSLVPRVHRSHR